MKNKKPFLGGASQTYLGDPRLFPVILTQGYLLFIARNRGYYSI